MNLLSIDTRTCQVRAYAITGGQRVRTVETTFNVVPDQDEVAAIRANPEKFIADLNYVAPPVPPPRPPLSRVDTTPCETEPSVA